MSRLFTITNAILLAVVVELLVLGMAAILSNHSAMFWEYAARYSARVSFVILAGLLLYTAIHGFLTISNNENKRKTLRALIYLFFVNHIIHFIYLATNQAVRNNILIKPGNIPGMIGYGLVLSLPLLLNRGLLSRGKQTILLVSLLLISAFFIFFYIAHLSGFYSSPDPSATWVYGLFTFVLILLVTANLYRHISDGRIARLSSS
jgi:hypothetical protein